MGAATSSDIQAFLTRLGQQYPHSASLYLLGGSALCLLGSPRQTLDVDYATNLSTPDRMLQAAMEAVAAEMDLEIEPVAFDEFIPILKTPTNVIGRLEHSGRSKSMCSICTALP